MKDVLRYFYCHLSKIRQGERVFGEFNQKPSGINEIGFANNIRGIEGRNESDIRRNSFLRNKIRTELHPL
jgi:hypothetical protein